ncbi:ATP-binding protein [Streptomyces sp. NPDC048002]|uniref:ATP-binding protein n=1 Tax=unclassified Streptomyces TaxID=2593676 RepID=UPI0033C3935B
MTTVATPPETGTGTRHHVALARSRHSPAVARRITARWLADHGMPPGATPCALLVVSELVTNTVRHTNGPCALTLTSDTTTIDIAVTDSSARLPRTPEHPRADAPGGRGLALLHALGARMTVESGPWGKTVHAELDLSGEPVHRRPESASGGG